MQHQNQNQTLKHNKLTKTNNIKQKLNNTTKNKK